MTAIGSPAPPLRYLDRTAYVQQVVAWSNGELTVEDVTAQEEESDRLRIQGARTYERFLAGEATYLGSSIGNQRIWDPQGNAQAIEQARQARGEQYALFSGDVEIDAVNVDSAVRIESGLTGGDLRSLSYYADYLRNEVAAATRAKGEVTFTGAWGTDKITNDVEEYVGWLFQAMRSNLQVTPDTDTVEAGRPQITDTV